MLYEIRIIVNRTVGSGILYQCAENRFIEFKARVIADSNFDSQRLRARLHNCDRLRVTIIRDKKGLAVWNGRMTKRHGFGGGGGFVQKRSIRDVERGQVDDHLLKIKERFQPALRELSLIGRVSSVPARDFEDVSVDGWRPDAV